MMRDAYHRSPGNDLSRWHIMEGVALALSRYFGHIGQFDVAYRHVKETLGVLPSSIHLKAAEHALELKREGKSVP